MSKKSLIGLVLAVLILPLAGSAAPAVRTRKFTNLTLSSLPSGTVPPLAITVTRGPAVYSIEISDSTEILDVSRRRLDFADLVYFKIGDKLNVDGVLNSSGNIISAAVIRNLSLHKKDTVGRPELKVAANTSMPPSPSLYVAGFNLEAKNADIKIIAVQFVSESAGGNLTDFANQIEIIDPATGGRIGCSNPIAFPVGVNRLQSGIQFSCDWVIARGTNKEIRLVAAPKATLPPVPVSFRAGIYDIAYTSPAAKVTGIPAYGTWLTVGGGTTTPTSTVSISLNANPSTIGKGDSSVLSWTSQNADKCMQSASPFDQNDPWWNGRGALNGARNVYPSVTTAYTLTCSNDKNSAAAGVTVTVLQNTTSTPTSTPPVAKTTVLSPNGGERWMAGERHRISWEINEDPVGVQLLKGGNVILTLSPYPMNPPYYNYLDWTISSSTVPGDDYKIKVSGKTSSDQSDAPFSIITATTTPPAPSVTVVYPNGGETWQIGSAQTIKWSSANAANAKILLGLVDSNIGAADTIAADLPNTGSYSLVVPSAWQPRTNSYRIYVNSYENDLRAQDASDGTFSVIAQNATTTPTSTVPLPTLTISAHPSSITQGESAAISWSSKNAAVCAASGAWSGNKPLAGSEAVQPQVNAIYVLTCSNSAGPVSQNATVYVKEKPTPIPSITVLSPNGGEAWITGSSYEISWVSSNLLSGSNISVGLYQGGALVQNLFSGLENGRHKVNWYVPNRFVGTNYKIGVSYAGLDGKTASDFSDGIFRIKYPSGADAGTDGRLSQMASILESMRQTLEAIAASLNSR